jgi:CRP-like cAMP-binding protein
MASDDTAVGYVIWGADHVVYGPVELPMLVAWVKDERVTDDTWIYLERTDCWEKAAHVPELQMFFHSHRAAASAAPKPGAPNDPLCPAALRHIKVLGGLNDEQIERFINAMQVQTLLPGARLARQGEPGDAMYLVLDGELRARMMVDGGETSVATLGAGEFFGEICLFDHGPRTADVFAARETTVLKIPASEFEKFTYEVPDLAAPFLLALTQSLVTRMRAENRRFRDSAGLARAMVPH